MKLGNISQTIVPVPNIFMNKTRNIETFNIYNKTDSNMYNTFNNSKKPISLKKNTKKQFNLEDSSSNSSSSINKRNSLKKYNHIFRDRDILTTFYDLNINNNPRSYTRQCIELNKEKYIPIYYNKNYPNMTQLKETFFPDIIELNNTERNFKNNKKSKKILSLKSLQNYYNYKKYVKDENISGLLSLDLREEIQNDTKNLIDRINMNYDLAKWTEFDTRKTFNRFFQTAYSPINDVNKNSKSIKDKFSENLKNKALSLKTISNKSKEVIEKSIIQKSFEEIIKQENNKDNNEDKSYDNLLNNCRTNLLNLKYNNCFAPKYNNKDQFFIDENAFITKRLNKTKLYKEFPSKTREEFNEKKIIKYKSLHKNNKVNKGNIILKDKYGTDDDNDNKNNDDYYYLKKMWKRPLHKDAFKLHE